ncbi:sugar transferase [Candidatus Moduliflexota bacterium]
MAMDKKQRGRVYGGYSKVFHLTNRLFNLALALLFILIAAPLMLVIAVINRSYSGNPVFFQSLRLGKNKRPFTMYKFRTLTSGAEEVIGPDVFDAGSSGSKHLLTPWGKFLRETRLDELPQLFNVIKGDMDFIGPRPVRPIIYENLCSTIPGYDFRFIEKPGLIGYSQLYTPHNSPKVIRAHIDNFFLRRKQRYLRDTLTILYTAAVVMKRVVLLSLRALWIDLVKVRILRQYSEKRNLERVSPQDVTVSIYDSEKRESSMAVRAKLTDINEEALSFSADQELGKNEFPFSLTMHYRKKGRVRKKTAHCLGHVYKVRSDTVSGRPSYVISYAPLSAFNGYIIHQYFLKKSFSDRP